MKNLYKHKGAKARQQWGLSSFVKWMAKPCFCLFFVFLFTSSYHLFSQDLKQTIQGRVLDSFTGAPIPGVNVAVQKGNDLRGDATNADGYFTILNLPIGKYSLQASFIGYKSHFADNLNLLSAKALNIEIRLEEALNELAEISVKAHQRKDDPLNKMALIGARSFNLDETNRYAGAYGDPARMAMNYAGVLPVRDNRNDIIIRGNSAFGVQWRIDDIEIPNPNHFGASGTTGGPVTIVNTNLLSNSDFFNGAFPAEYGNAIAGVFDLKMKASNIQKHEKWFQMGWNGLELGAEGPLRKGKHSSYLISYRHALNDILYQMGIPSKDIIKYKDLSFKFNFPRTRLGNWSIIGMGGNSNIILDELSYEKDERSFETYGEIIDNYTSMGVLGLTNKIYPNNNTKIVSTLSVTGSTVKNQVDTFSVPQNTPFLWATEDTEELKYSFSSRINHKFSAKSNFTAGAIFDHYILSFNDVQYKNCEYQHFTSISNTQTDLVRAFVGLKQNLGTQWETYLGLHGQYFFLNQSQSVEPRASAKYTINDRSSISYGIGWHSQVQPKPSYYVISTDNDGATHYTNKNLGFTKSIHHVIGHNYLINENLRIKLDVYHQQLYNVPIRETQPEYSLINFGTEYYVERKDSLVNEGTGKNYGIEMTLEKFLANNYFYLFTASLFESNYTSTDNVTRNTAYNGGYALNALGGYELFFPKKDVTLIFGVNLTYAGGSPYVPFDQQESVKSGRTSFDWNRAYEVNRKDYKRISLRLGVRRNLKKMSMETSFDFQYRSDYTSIYLEKIDVTTGEIINTDKLGLHPMVNMRISF
ncbi:carboxypeptidase-like regulatory domain-containing protein [bacterium]|nr:carboxypeptidase-like regulatory domain-containing protein [bacterium]